MFHILTCYCHLPNWLKQFVIRQFAKFNFQPTHRSCFPLLPWMAGRLLCTADYDFVCRSNWTCMWANCKWDDFQALNSADDKNIKMLMIVFCYGGPLNSNVYIYDINPRTSNCEAVRCRQNRSSRLNCFKVASIFEKLMPDYIVLNILIIILIITNSKLTNRCSCIEKLFGAYKNPKWFSLACLTFYLKRQRLMGGPHD